MTPVRTFSAPTEDILWQQVAADLSQQTDLFEYNAELIQDGYHVQLSIDVDLGGGFEGGLETTTFTAVLPAATTLRFALHEQDWVHEIGKFLGLEDVELNAPDLDDAFIITTNDPDTLGRLLLRTPGVREALLRYRELRLTLAPATDETDAPIHLTFTKEAALLDPVQLRQVYYVVFALLRQIAPVPSSQAGAATGLEEAG